MSITRRQFLKYSAAGAAALSATSLMDKAALATSLGSTGGQMGVLVDTTRCVGCRQCQLACKKKNNLPADATVLPANETFPDQLNENTFTLVEFRPVAGGDPTKPVLQPVKKQCMHCQEPACVSVCPVKALEKTPEGPVTYDAEKCLGCRYCLAACPFDVPKYEWSSGNPRVRKCNMCADLVEQGAKPACVAACPAQALTFGTRAELVAEAQTRVQAIPAKYNPYIYGLNEVGGTSYLYLANQPFDKLGFPTNLPLTPLPDLTWQVMEKVPGIAVGVGLVLGAISFWNSKRAPSAAQASHIETKDS